MDRMKQKECEGDMFMRRIARNIPNRQDINNTPIRPR